jgi:hypothetical protein
MDAFHEFLHMYRQQSGLYSESDLQGLKQINRSYSLELMKKDKHSKELMLIYNMAGHVSPEDPAGINYALSKISGPNPALRVNSTVLGMLLCELAEHVYCEAARLKRQAGAVGLEAV